MNNPAFVKQQRKRKKRAYDEMTEEQREKYNAKMKAYMAKRRADQSKEKA